MMKDMRAGWSAELKIESFRDEILCPDTSKVIDSLLNWSSAVALHCQHFTVSDGRCLK